jgi:hypothetical protein
VSSRNAARSQDHQGGRALWRTSELDHEDPASSKSDSSDERALILRINSRGAKVVTHPPPLLPSTAELDFGMLAVRSD